MPEAYERTDQFGNRLADRIERGINAAVLAWATIRFGPRTGQWYGPRPSSGVQAAALLDHDLARLIPDLDGRPRDLGRAR